jgi:hypothetical protein
MTAAAIEPEPVPLVRDPAGRLMVPVPASFWTSSSRTSSVVGRPSRSTMRTTGCLWPTSTRSSLTTSITGSEVETYLAEH